MNAKFADASTLSDRELVEALEMLAPALRLARLETLRAVADRAAELALEAADRIRDNLVALGNPEPLPPAPPGFMARSPGALLGKIRDVTIDERGTLTARLEVNDAGAEFIRQIRGDNPDEIGFHK